MVHRRGEKSETGAGATSFSDDDDDAKKSAPLARISRVGGAFLFLALYLLLTLSKQTNKRKSQVMDAPMKTKGGRNLEDPMIDYGDFSKAVSKYDNCVIKFQPPPPKSKWDTKPLWLTAHPGTGTVGPSKGGDFMKPLVNAITGLKGGAKFYHASSKILKRCKGLDEAATCSNGHPIVGIGPENQKGNFYNKMILVLRNFQTTFPSHINEKAMAYHGATEQIPVEQWRKTRDQWYTTGWEGWKKVIMTWKEMQEYEIGMYVQYEALFDPDRGPIVAQKLADLLQGAGFTVAPKEDIPCIWYRSIKNEVEGLKNWKYRSGYTKEQRDLIVKEHDTFIAEVAATDKDLAAVLKEYRDHIKENTLLDSPAE